MRRILLNKDKIKFEVSPKGKKFINSSKPAPAFTDDELFELAFRSLGKNPYA